MTTLEPPLTRPRPRRTRASSRVGAGAVIAIVFALIINVAAIVGVVWVLGNAQRVEDQVAVWQFEPSPELEQYVQRAGLGEEGTFLFFASRPVIASGEEFDNACAARTEGVGILGCYRPSDRSIVLFDVTDDRLDGIEEVVAAHEMLHAAWDRMSTA